jgi:hypothetical protein
MSSEEMIGKSMSFELMVKDSEHIVNLEQGATSTPEVQLVTPLVLLLLKLKHKIISISISYV